MMGGKMILTHLMGMEFTRGELMFYGGMIAIVVLILLSIILLLAFHSKKKKLINKIEKEY
jgi:cell division protein FtsL